MSGSQREGAALVAWFQPLLEGVFPEGAFAVDGLERLRTACRGLARDDFEDVVVPGPDGPLRLRRVRATESPRALLLDLHGGGGVFGAPEMNDVKNVHLASFGVTVVGVDYRLAPEHAPSAAIADAVAAARWLLSSAELEVGGVPLLIGGDSYGAALAVNVLVTLRDTGLGGSFSGAILECGEFDLSGTPSQFLGGTLGLDPMGGELGLRFRELLHPGATVADLRRPDRSPLYADLSGMPPALFICGTADDLIDDTLFMAARWELTTVPVVRCLYRDAPHWPTRLPSVLKDVERRLREFIELCA